MCTGHLACSLLLLISNATPLSHSAVTSGLAHPRHLQTACPPGTGGPICAPCDTRSASPFGVVCRACGPGTQPDAANVACVTCGAGKVSVAGYCDVCANGMQPALDHQSCISCPLGRWASSGGRCTTYVAFKENKVASAGAGNSAYFWCDATQLVRWIFDSADSDKDGNIRRSELRLSPFDDSLRGHWLLIDTDSDHQASWQEWSRFFAFLKMQLGDRWRAYILRTGCRAASGESSCTLPMHSQPAPGYGSCTACMNAITDDGRACRVLPSLSCAPLPNGTVSCTLSSTTGSTDEVEYLAAFGSQFEDPACTWPNVTTTVSFSRADMVSSSCSFVKSPVDASYSVQVGIRASSLTDGHVESHAVYSLNLVPSNSTRTAADPTRQFTVAISGPTTVPVSPLTLSIHRSCDDELVAPTTAEEYVSTTYTYCLKATLCCGYTFSVTDATGKPPLRSFFQAPNATAAAVAIATNGSGVVSYLLLPPPPPPGSLAGLGSYVEPLIDILPGGQRRPLSSASVTLGPLGNEMYVKFQPAAVVDDAGIGFFHVKTAVQTPAGDRKALGSTLPIRVKRTKKNDALPSVVAASQASRFQVIPKLLVAVTVLVAVAVGATLAYRAYKNRDKKLVPNSFSRGRHRLAGEHKAFMSDSNYLTFDDVGDVEPRLSSNE